MNRRLDVAGIPKSAGRLAAILPPLLIVFVGIIAYRSSLAAPFILDDQYTIVENPDLRHPLETWRDMLGKLRPVVTLSLALNYALGGLEVRGYHLFNIAIHVLATLTLYGLVRRTLLLPQYRERYGGATTGLALASALLWLVHPLQTESVTYTIQRAEELMGLFYLLTLSCLLRGASGGARGWYLASVLACALGMASKEVMITAPLVALLYDRAFLAGSWAEVLRRRGLFYLALGATAVLPFLGKHPGGAGFAMRGLTPWEYARSQPGVLLHYLRLSVWPAPLCLDYGWPVAQTTAAIVLPGFVIVALLAAVAWAWFRAPAVGFLGLSFFLILAPTSSILPIRDLAVEHRMYLSLAAESVLLVLAGHAVLRMLLQRRMIGPSTATALSGGAVILFVVLLGILTDRRNQVYGSAVSIWSDVVAQRPENWRGQLNLGCALLWQGHAEEEHGRRTASRKTYQQAVRSITESLRLLPGQPLAHYTLGQTYAQLGDLEQAAREYARAVELAPDYRDAHDNLGNLLFRAQRFAEAAQHYETAVRLQPADPMSHYNLGLARFGQHDTDGAIGAYEAALALNPQFAEARGDLGTALLWKGRTEEAIRQCTTALDDHPDDAEAHFTRSLAYLVQGKKRPAFDDAQAAVRSAPQGGKYVYGLAHVLRELNQQPAAARLDPQARQLDPAWPQEAGAQAWALATAADAAARNGALAVLLATIACEATNDRQPEFLDALAAAYAEVGRFDAARAAAATARDLAQAAGRVEQAAHIATHLLAYQANQPWRQK